MNLKIINKTKIIFIIILVFFFSRGLIPKEKAGKAGDFPPLEEVNPLPEHILCFPWFSVDYKRKIKTNNKKYEIHDEKKIVSWAKAQGFEITRDSGAGELKHKRGVIFFPPKLEYELYIPKNDFDELEYFGWSLILDMGFLKSDNMPPYLSTDYVYSENMQRYEIYIDGILYKEIELGFGKTHNSPVEIYIPFVRDKEGKITVEIKIPHSANSFGILYDAFLVKK